VTIDGYTDVPTNDEEQLLQAVATQPVSVGIAGSGMEFQFYSKVCLPYGIRFTNCWSLHVLTSLFIRVIGDFRWPVFNFFGSCCINRRLWFRKWSGLLDFKEFMGRKVGNGWLYAPATRSWKSQRVLWYQHVGFISNKDWCKSSSSPTSTTRSCELWYLFAV
jgi:hypothetical protein